MKRFQGRYSTYYRGKPLRHGGLGALRSADDRHGAAQPEPETGADSFNVNHTDWPYELLDLTSLGKQEAWEAPKGRALS